MTLNMSGHPIVGVNRLSAPDPVTWNLTVNFALSARYLAESVTIGETGATTADLIDGMIGENSPFHETFGYYAETVDLTTVVLPCRWRERVCVIDNPNTNGVRGYCLEIHDVALSKLMANREKDREYVASLYEAGLIDKETLQDRISELDPEVVEAHGGSKVIEARIRRVCHDAYDEPGEGLSP